MPTAPPDTKVQSAITETDYRTLEKCPKGWFDYMHDAVFPIRCVEYRLERLANHGLLEWKVSGAYPSYQRRYRLTKKGREARHRWENR